ncbi:MAG: histidine phosphatase family protein [Synergistaceae bacterium]|jgi:broad specificity phosphatase PhoE|nr:histidine phosphatase family protein [Synergistaceae bacterium]
MTEELERGASFGAAGARKMSIFMLRHGAPEFPDERPYLYGHSDYPLSELGLEQARRTAEELSGVIFERIISSDLTRAVQTAEIVASAHAGKPCGVERDARLREIFMGDWDGVPKDEATLASPEVFRARGVDFANIAAPGGETFSDLRERAAGALESIIESSKGMRRILIVAHGGVFWTILSRLFNVELKDVFRFCQDYCALHLVEHDPQDERGRFRLIFCNRLPTLSRYSDDAI